MSNQVSECEPVFQQELIQNLVKWRRSNGKTNKAEDARLQFLLLSTSTQMAKLLQKQEGIVICIE